MLRLGEMSLACLVPAATGARAQAALRIHIRARLPLHHGGLCSHGGASWRHSWGLRRNPLMLRRGVALQPEMRSAIAEGSRASPQRWRTQVPHAPDSPGAPKGNRNAFKNGRYIGGGNRAMAGDFGGDPNGRRVRRKDTFRCSNVLVAWCVTRFRRLRGEPRYTCVQRP